MFALTFALRILPHFEFIAALRHRNEQNEKYSSVYDDGRVNTSYPQSGCDIEMVIQKNMFLIEIIVPAILDLLYDITTTVFIRYNTKLMLNKR